MSRERWVEIYRDNRGREREREEESIREKGYMDEDMWKQQREGDRRERGKVC